MGSSNDILTGSKECVDEEVRACNANYLRQIFDLAFTNYLFSEV